MAFPSPPHIQLILLQTCPPPPIHLTALMMLAKAERRWTRNFPVPNHSQQILQTTTQLPMLPLSLLPVRKTSEPLPRPPFHPQNQPILVLLRTVVSWPIRTPVDRLFLHHNSPPLTHPPVPLLDQCGTVHYCWALTERLDWLNGENEEAVCETRPLHTHSPSISPQSPG
ncbi:hypothetical protein CCUS01_05407 [Colletotrichum cuscutae]|uniref:Uncharacterized protein n=1 Tax=Colletotrichum cuscutae TaxID=1209917 RepID=A0AAI9VD23_9PEZI|nr:hypothetical protein CCUS01_05407 [Colletotrichum cuscutae]